MRKYLILLLLGAFFLEASLFIVSGKIHLDEGAYLYASRAVYSGKMPYRDFFFLQPPVHPYIYGFFQRIHPGLASARITSAAFGLLSFVVVALIVKSRSDLNTAILALALMIANPFQVYFFCITRLYALSCFLIVSGCFFLTRDEHPGRSNSIIASLCFSLAALTRLTTLPVLFLALLYFIFRSRGVISRIAPMLFTTLFVSFVIFLLVQETGSEKLLFNLLGMNLSLHANNLLGSLFEKFRATSQFFRYYLLVFILLTPVILHAFSLLSQNTFRKTLEYLFSREGILWTMSFTLIAIQSSAKIYQVSYQTLIMPLLIGLVAISWSRHCSHCRPQFNKRLLIFLFIGCSMTLVSYHREFLQFVDGKPALIALKEQVAFIKQYSQTQDSIFSADSALIPTEAQHDVLDGMAGSDLFPDWSYEKCKNFHVLNFEILSEYISDSKSPIIIIGDKSFSLSLPYLEPISQHLRQNVIDLICDQYSLLATFPNLFISGTNTYYYIKKGKTGVSIENPT